MRLATFEMRIISTHTLVEDVCGVSKGCSLKILCSEFRGALGPLDGDVVVREAIQISLSSGQLARILTRIS